MNDVIKKYDCIVIGGGMFGLYVSKLMSSKGAKVALLEKEKLIFNRASKTNQSRIHRGYHYPRSFETAQKTSNYYDRFCEDFGFALLKPFKQYYSISRDDSKINADDYIKFCNELNLPLKEIDSSNFFQKNKVSATFEVDESCFDYLKIREYFMSNLRKNHNIDTYYETFPVSQKISASKYVVGINSSLQKLGSPIVINTTYKNVNELNKMFDFPEYKLKYELCELSLCEVNNLLTYTGVTVLDGPFFSLMPFGKGKISSLSSVRHTPIETNYFEPQNEKCNMLNKSEVEAVKYSNREKMESLAKSYLKSDLSFKYKSSIFEIKPILVSSEEDDSRPTIVTTHSEEPLFLSVMAGKISTIYDLDSVVRNLM